MKKQLLFVVLTAVTIVSLDAKMDDAMMFRRYKEHAQLVLHGIQNAKGNLNVLAGHTNKAIAKAAQTALNSLERAEDRVADIQQELCSKMGKAKKH